MSMPSDADIDRMLAARIAAKLEDSPKSMAWVLALYKDAEGVDDAAVARLLDIDEHRLHHLAMCGRPHPYVFAENIESIAEHIGVDQQKLASIIRHVEALETFRKYQDAAAEGMVAAARDVAAADSAEYNASAEHDESASEVEPDDEQ